MSNSTPPKASTGSKLASVFSFGSILNFTASMAKTPQSKAAPPTSLSNSQSASGASKENAKLLVSDKAGSATKRKKLSSAQPANKKRKVSDDSSSTFAQTAAQTSPQTDAADGALLNGESDSDPFSVVFESVKKQTPNNSGKKRKHAYDEWTSSFDSSLNVLYNVQPNKKRAMSWDNNTAVSTLPFDGNSLRPKDIIYVLADPPPRQLTKDSQPNDDKWVAEIVEIHAPGGDVRQGGVFLLVNWLYRPEDLPKGRATHHADGEVIASNHMDVIELASVVGKVDAFGRLKEDSYQSVSGGYPGLFWRESFNAKTNAIRRAKPICACRVPANPDFGPVLCTSTSAKCGLLMHPECAEGFVLERLYQRYVVSDGTTNVAFQRPRKRGKGRPSELMNGIEVATERIREAKKYFQCTLRRPTVDRGQGSKLLARVTVISELPTRDGMALDNTFDYPVRCVGCHAVLLQQKGHAILDPNAELVASDTADSDFEEDVKD